jgi:hypothetical protein
MLTRDAKSVKAGEGCDFDVTGVNESVIKDIKYFQKDLNASINNKNHQNVNYTWEKPPAESPSIFDNQAIINESPNKRLPQYINTLDAMATHHGCPQIIPQNKWEADVTNPPKLVPNQEKRRTAVMSAMTQ